MTASLLGPALVFLASPAQSVAIRQFDIPAQPLASALLQIARQGDVNIIASERLTRGLSAPSLRGAMTSTQATERVLAGSPLTYRVTPDGTIVIIRRAATVRKAPAKPPTAARRTARKAAPPPPPVEDIIVRAQRRAEMARDVPLSVAAFEQEALNLAGVHKPIDLQQLDPSLVISAQSGVIIPFLRGIGNPASATAGNESSIPVYIDDAYFSRLYPAYLTLDHVDRVEVLKGPQGTLFGRNSTGGLIQIFTRDPGSEPEVDGEIGIANFDTLTAKAYLASPLMQTLSASVSLTVHEQGKGWGRNEFTDQDAYFADYLVVRSKAIWQPANETEIRLSGFYVRENSSIGTVQGGGIDGFPRGIPPEFDRVFERPKGFYDIATNFPTLRRHRGWGGVLKVEHGLDFADFTSISFYRKSKDPWTSEGDHTPYPWLQYTLPVLDRQLTQELQLKSRPDSQFDWIIGLYYMKSRASIDPTSVAGEAVTGPGYDSFNLAARQTIRSRAAYGQATIPLRNGKTRITGGIRYTFDTVHGIGDQYAIVTGTGERYYVADHIDDISKFDQVTYKASIDHDFGDDLMAYASFSTGFKSGTYNLIPLEKPALNPEKVDAYEVGLKGAWLDGRIRLALSAFQNDIADPQVQIVKEVGGVATNQFVNAERSRSRGVDFSGAFAFSPQATIKMAGQFLDAKFVRFESAPFNSPLFIPPFGVVTTAGDASGNATPLSPKVKLNFELTHRFSHGGIRWTMDGNLAYRSSYKWEPDNRITEPALTLVNASLTIEPQNILGWSLRVWGNNITNQRYFSNVLTQSGPTGFMSSPAEPRTFGVALRFKR